ncbi:ferredoxin [Actinomadura sp. CNU-125]|uniref:ferredoxin n=1 Tax=Actinomadura sp. CNU-125 TaxID=1904961 RepID=UPI00096373DD|nr:ferredoxin [Actinomadura sp. CNU-125]OLT31386.1 ferredoxin [Actinomadura sp. CNU-125]
MSRLSVDRDACRGAGQCAFNAPELFDQDEDEGLVVLLNAEPSPGQLPSARRAADACPNRVIVLAETPERTDRA